MNLYHHSFAKTWMRRLVTVPIFILIALALVLTSPIWVTFTSLYELTFGRGYRFSRLRTLMVITTFFVLEGVGVLIALFLWIVFIGRSSSSSFTQAHLELQWWWTTTNFAAMKRIFNLGLHIENEDLGAKGPYLLFVRHSSVMDTLLASLAISKPFGIGFRYILKQELLWDPCLDIVGQRLDSVFLTRQSKNRERELKSIVELASNLDENTGVLIYPEGTRFTPKKLARIKAKDTNDEYPELKAMTDSFQNVLPPRPAGVTSLLTSRPELDVVFLEHHGFENGVKFKDFWRGSFVNNKISIRLRRVRAADIPRDGDLAIWLFKQWQHVDEWVTARVAEGAKV